MNQTRITIALMLFFASLAPTFADTIAVAVRSDSDAEDAGVLAALVEQGAMDHLFLNGNIVFDLEIDPTDEMFAFRAIDEGALGGARAVVLLDLALDAFEGWDTYPVGVEVRVFEVDGENERVRAAISADELQAETDATPETMAVLLGRRASAIALEAIGGGDAAW